MRLIVIAVVLFAVSVPAIAAGKIYYGSRAGMEVTVTGVSGIGTAHAKIRVEHTPADAKEFCVGYSNDQSQECVERELRDTHLNDVLEGNCATGEFTSLYGESLKFAGENKRRQEGDPKYRILGADGPLGGDSASGYSYDLEQFKALCPALVDDIE